MILPLSLSLSRCVYFTNIYYEWLENFKKVISDSYHWMYIYDWLTSRGGWLVVDISSHKFG